MRDRDVRNANGNAIIDLEENTLRDRSTDSKAKIPGKYGFSAHGVAPSDLNDNPRHVLYTTQPSQVLQHSDLHARLGERSSQAGVHLTKKETRLRKPLSRLRIVGRDSCPVPPESLQVRLPYPMMSFQSHQLAGS